MERDPMRPATIGGGLVIGAAILGTVAAGLAATGEAVGIGAAGAGSLVLTAAIAAAAAGFVTLAIVGPPAIGGRLVRAGLGLLGLGLGCSLIATVVAAAMTTDPLELFAFVVPFLVGGVASAAAIPVVVLGLLLRPGGPRRIGVAFLAGCAALLIASQVASAWYAANPGSSTAPLPATLAGVGGFALLVGSLAAIGLTAIREPRPRPA